MTPAASTLARVDARGFTRDEVLLATGATYRQLDYWVRSALVTPTGNSHKNARRYRVADIRQVLLLRLLSKVSGPASFRPMAVAALNALSADPEARYVAVAGDRAAAHRTPEACVAEALSWGTAVHVFNLTLGHEA